ncbi:hypothetical protein KY289_026925 [Solanum tuberosum]|nr:hypothetical protein KY289_026925 [Solanum tuberosum]
MRILVINLQHFPSIQLEKSHGFSAPSIGGGAFGVASVISGVQVMVGHDLFCVSAGRLKAEATFDSF